MGRWDGGNLASSKRLWCLGSSTESHMWLQWQNVYYGRSHLHQLAGSARKENVGPLFKILTISRWWQHGFWQTRGPSEHRPWAGGFVWVSCPGRQRGSKGFLVLKCNSLHFHFSSFSIRVSTWVIQKMYILNERHTVRGWRKHVFFWLYSLTGLRVGHEPSSGSFWNYMMGAWETKINLEGTGSKWILRLQTFN